WTGTKSPEREPQRRSMGRINSISQDSQDSNEACRSALRARISTKSNGQDQQDFPGFFSCRKADRSHVGGCSRGRFFAHGNIRSQEERSPSAKLNEDPRTGGTGFLRIHRIFSCRKADRSHVGGCSRGRFFAHGNIRSL